MGDAPVTDDPVKTRAVGLALAVLVLVVALPVVQPRSGLQQASRYALTAALWDHQTVQLDGYERVLGRDHAIRDGVIYSDKAPGQPFFAVPFYGLYRLAGGQPAEIPNTGVDWGLWWVTIWSAAIPAAVLTYMMFTWAREVSPSGAVPATIAVVFGTLLLVYSTLLFGHVLAASFLLAMFLLVRKREASFAALGVAGLLGGLAVLTEYPTALIVAVLAAAALSRHRLKGLAVLAGGLPAAALLALYNMRVAGSYFVLSYQWTGFVEELPEEESVFHMFAGPEIERLVHVLFSERGLLVATPIIVLGLAGLALLWGRIRFDAVVAMLTLIALLVIQASWANSYAGGAGPRYLVPAMPFLAAPVAMVFERWRRGAVPFAVLSILTMVLATLTEPQLPSDLDAGLAHWALLALNGRSAPNLFEELVGPFGWVLYLGSVLMAVFFVMVTVRKHRPQEAHVSKSAVVLPIAEDMNADV